MRDGLATCDNDVIARTPRSTLSFKPTQLAPTQTALVSRTGCVCIVRVLKPYQRGFYLRHLMVANSIMACSYYGQVTHPEPSSSIHGSGFLPVLLYKGRITYTFYCGPDLIRHTKTTFSGLLADGGQFLIFVCCKIVFRI